MRLQSFEWHSQDTPPKAGVVAKPVKYVHSQMKIISLSSQSPMQSWFFKNEGLATALASNNLLSMFTLGLEKLLQEPLYLEQFSGLRVSLLTHPAAVDKDLRYSMDLLQNFGLNITSAFGPQHGLRGEKQDNMVESDDYNDPVYHLPVYSLYGKHLRPTQKMLDSFDILLVDLQDVGCRVYTFLTTLFYMMEACTQHKKSIYVLDRPNPAGREVEGSFLDMDYESFVGSAPIPIRHGLTLGEMGLWYMAHKNLTLDYHVVNMSEYKMTQPPFYGWTPDRAWVNPSPNLPRISGTQMYCGTVLLEGTLLSEGRGTTRPLEVVGAPEFPTQRILKRMEQWAPEWMESCLIRPCFFEPTFQKHHGQLCSGMQIHVDYPNFNPSQFKPYRLISLLLKATRRELPEFHLWKGPPYEYETKLMPFDILSGSSLLREWIEDPKVHIKYLEEKLSTDENKWKDLRKPFLLYK